MAGMCGAYLPDSLSKYSGREIDDEKDRPSNLCFRGYDNIGG